MDCSLCEGTPVTAYFSRMNCFEEVKNMMNLMNKDKKAETTSIKAATNWGTQCATEWMEDAKKREEECNKHIGLLAVAFREGSYSDIQVKPGNGPSIPAHRFLLATTSEVLKTMLASDLCKSAPIDSISLPEFNHEELETFLEFLYCGKLAKEKFDMHFQSLTLAADKYVIPHLQTYCEQHILKLLDSSNALKILEFSEILSNEVLKVASLKSILSHTKEIYFSPGFEDFARQNPHLMVQIARAHSRRKRNTGQLQYNGC
ncbi:hypothetical protein C5167_002378 [Papaver somniferum]|uniref:BTB domain-containing protein n=2 Tax=Papaver somniferum TaxID=3469 RepID=A0A4Y7KZ57_PAPSO|nr:hypothetical protein C5167_002378 [Papaver somniferum]